MSAIRDLVAGLARGADTLGGRLNERKDRRDALAERDRQRQMDADDALRELVLSGMRTPPKTMETDQGIMEWDPSMAGWRPAMTAPSMQLPDLARGGISAMPEQPTRKPLMPYTKPPVAKEPTEEPVIPVVQGDKVIYVPRSKAAGQEAPRSEPRTPLVTDASGKRVPDREGVQVKTDAQSRSGFSALPPAQQSTVRDQQSALLNMQKAVRALQDAVQEGGMALAPGAYQAKIRSLQANAIIQAKEAARLGALAGPDMALVTDALGSALSPLQLARGGSKGVLTSLESAQQSLRDRARTMEQVYGVAMPPEFYGAQPPVKYSPDNPFAKPPA